MKQAGLSRPGGRKFGAQTVECDCLKAACRPQSFDAGYWPSILDPLEPVSNIQAEDDRLHVDLRLVDGQHLALSHTEAEEIAHRPLPKMGANAEVLQAQP